MVNVKLLHKELRFIAENPEKWNQGSWVNEIRALETELPAPCNTFGCLAGNTVIHKGDELLWNFYDGVWETEWTIDGARVSERARQYLELTHDQASALFAPSNTYYRLWELAMQFSDGGLTIEQRKEAIEIYYMNRSRQLLKEMFTILDENPHISDTLRNYGELVRKRTTNELTYMHELDLLGIDD